MSIRNGKKVFSALFIFVLGNIQLAAAAPSEGELSLSGVGANVKNACQSDIKEYCDEVSPGQGRILSCLNSKQDKLSEGCRSSMTLAEANLSQRMDKADVAFRKSCGTDVQKFCADVPSGKGRLLECLSKNKSQVSEKCTKFQAKLRQKLAEFIG